MTRRPGRERRVQPGCKSLLPAARTDDKILGFAAMRPDLKTGRCITKRRKAFQTRQMETFGARSKNRKEEGKIDTPSTSFSAAIQHPTQTPAYPTAAPTHPATPVLITATSAPPTKTQVPPTRDPKTPGSRRDCAASSLPAHLSLILGLDYSPDGKLLASASWDFTAKGSGIYLQIIRC